MQCNEYIKEVTKSNFYHSRCFKIKEKVATRDWINLGGLFALSNEFFLDPIINNLKDDVIVPEEKTLIIGVNYYGAIFASIIGYRYDIPFTYCFDKKRSVSEFERDLKNFESTKYNRLLFVIDILVCGDTVYDLVDKMELGKNIKVDVLVLFERELSIPASVSLQKRKYPKIYTDFRIRYIYILNDDFPFVICDESECQYAEDDPHRCKYGKLIT